jgi:hypothetical protein
LPHTHKVSPKEVEDVEASLATGTYLPVMAVASEVTVNNVAKSTVAHINLSDLECNLHDSIKILNLVEIDRPNLKFGGRIRYFLKNWEKITQDVWVLQNVQGHHLEFLDLPIQNKEPHWPKFSTVETNQIHIEIQKLVEKGAVEVVSEIAGQFLSHLFLRPKKDGSQRWK